MKDYLKYLISYNLVNFCFTTLYNKKEMILLKRECYFVKK